MPTANLVIIGIAVGLVFAVVTIIWRNRYRDLFAGFLVLGILALAVVVTIYQVNQYWAQRAAVTEAAQSQPPATSGSSVETPPRAPFAVQILPPMVQGPRGAAAPPAAHAPLSAGNP